MDSGMLLLLLVLGGIMMYVVFDPKSLIGPWLDKYCKDEKDRWTGEPIEPHYQESTPKKKRKYKKRTKK